MDELNVLLMYGTFNPVLESTIPGTSRIFESRFVEELKEVGERLKKKSLLVTRNYSDEGSTSIVTKALTVQQFSQRLALCFAASMLDLRTDTRDITQASFLCNVEFFTEYMLYSVKNST